MGSPVPERQNYGALLRLTERGNECQVGTKSH